MNNTIIIALHGLLLYITGLILGFALSIIYRNITILQELEKKNQKTKWKKTKK